MNDIRSFSIADTPSLMVDIEVMEGNLDDMQRKADSFGVKLRPHVKTHRSVALAKMQIESGASGITVAKLTEADVMAEGGVDDIFVANEIVGNIKLERLAEIRRKVRRIAVAVDHMDHISILNGRFKDPDRPLEVLLDVNTGDPRTGIEPGPEALDLARSVWESPGLSLRGIYSHDGQSYDVEGWEGVIEVNRNSQQAVIDLAKTIRDHGISCEEVSVGSTPSLLLGEILPGVTEIRPGTYIFMDADQANVLGSYDRCALSVFATVISRPTRDRVVLDAGTKALTYYVQDKGICRTPGHGVLKRYPSIHLNRKSDEHSSFDIPSDMDVDFHIGERLEIIPNHACPTVNLYDFIYGVKGGEVAALWPVSCRGCSR